MVTSLAFGVLFATGVTLILVPALYLMGEDFGKLMRRLAERFRRVPSGIAGEI